MKKTIVVLAIVLLAGCSLFSSGPYKFEVTNNSSVTADIFIDPEGYFLGTPDGIVKAGESKLIEYLEGSHYLVALDESDYSSGWERTEYFDDDFEWILVD